MIAFMPVIIAALFLSCKKSAQNSVNKLQPVEVRIEFVKRQRLVDMVEVAGTVKAGEEANISAEEGGIVVKWKIRKGQQVKKGDVVAILKDDVIKAGWAAAEAQYKMAELNLQKQQGVFDEKGISELQFKNLEYGRDAAKAGAELMKARWEHTQIRSPIDGVLDNTIPHEGELAPPGVPIARVVNMSVVKVVTEIPELYAGTISPGTPALVTFDALPGDTIRGRVSFVSSTVSSTNRAFAAELIQPNTFRHLKAEMVAKVRLLRVTKNDAILVSESVVQLVDRDRMIVYVANNGRAEERRLKLGSRQGGQVEVLEGLNAGDHLIVVGYQKLVNGTPVIASQQAESLP